MNHKIFSMVVAVIFSAIAALHASRIVWGWDAIIGNFVMPFWVSWVAVFVAGYIAVQAWKLSR